MAAEGRKGLHACRWPEVPARAVSLLWRALLGLTLLWPVAGTAAQLTATIRQQRLGLVIEGVRLPQSFLKDVTSGLTSRILIQLTLLDGGMPIASKGVDIALKYDLWEESFSMTLAVDSTTVESRTLARTEDVIAMLSHLSVPSLFPTARLDRTRALTIAARVLFNPIERERLDEIRKWVAENSRPSPPDPQNASGVPAPPPGSESHSLFDRIFEQYAAGAAVAAAFSDSGVSKPFRLEDLHDEPDR